MQEDNKDNAQIIEAEFTDDIIDDTVEGTTEDTISDTTVDIIDDAVEGASDEVAEEVAEEAIEESTDEAAETSPKKKGTAKKILKYMGILLLICLIAAGGYVGYKVWDYLQVYVYTDTLPYPTVLEGENISISIDDIEVIDDIIGFEEDENYVYLGIKYTVTNKSAKALTWKELPLLMVREYVRDEEDTGYVLVEGTEQGYELSGLRNYGIDLEIDFTTAKDDLPAGEGRVSADIFKISKADYISKKYFLTTDIVDNLVELPVIEMQDAPVDTPPETQPTE